jgi:DNA polymerase
VPTLSIDFETRSTVDLRKSGVYPYAAHPTTEVLCMAYAVDNMEPMLWVPGDPVPGDVLEAVEQGWEFRAYNAQFERLIWQILVDREGFPSVPLESWVCTQAEARAMALPTSKGMVTVAKVLRCDQQKDEDGHKLMLQMCKPRKPRKGEDPDGLYWFEDPARLNRLYAYCLDDVRTERAVASKLRRLSAHEREIYLLDQRINDRGVHLDVGLIEAAQEMRDEAVDRASAAMHQLTDGEVRGVTDMRGLRSYLQVDSVAEAEVKELLAGELSPIDRQLLELRRDNGKSSVAKLDTMMLVLHNGGAHGLLQYHGADTGRWAGRLVQPQNFPRPSIKNIEQLIPLVTARDYDGIEEHAPVMEVLSSMLRSMLTPHPGQTFYCADFSAIEGWVVAWLAGQDGMTSYEEMAAAIFGLPVDEIGEDSTERQVGKVAVLGCGYGMGINKYIDTVYDWTGINLHDPNCAGCQAKLRGNKAEHEGCTGQRAVNTYRTVNAPIKELWYAAEDAMVAAVRRPGEVTTTTGGRVRFRVKGQFLWAVLPSGRPLCYPLPKLVDTITPWGAEKQAVEISTTNSYTRKWERRTLYGGLIVENLTQAIARDVMADAMLRVEAAGYPIVLTVHDEVLAESAAGNLDEFQQLMSLMPEWSGGLQLKVSGWEGRRYRK